ncbi:MAG: sigma-54-dependent transcriptional regulator [Acidobacteriota bacterium]
MRPSRRPLGRDPAFRAALALAEKAASAPGPVLLVGPTGSGKSRLARYIHDLRLPKPGTFTEWHAPGVPSSLLEAEFFGVERGAATGVAPRAGIFEESGTGTLCLSGVEWLAPDKQAALLRILEGSPFQRIGGGRRLTCQARVLAAFSEPPELLVARGQLRQDLLFRLDVLRIHLPALGERTGDIPLLARHFLRAACRQSGRSVPEMAPSLIEALSKRPWPGNLRELARCMEGLALSGGTLLVPEDLPAEFWMAEPPAADALRRRLTLEELKDAYIRFVLARTSGNRTRAARWLGISRKALWAHLRRSET